MDEVRRREENTVTVDGDGYRLVNPQVHAGLNGPVLITGLQSGWTRFDLSGLRRTRFAHVGVKWPHQHRSETTFSPDCTDLVGEAYQNRHIVPTMYGHGLHDGIQTRSLEKLRAYSSGLAQVVEEFLEDRELVILSAQAVYSKDDEMHLKLASTGVLVFTDDAPKDLMIDFPSYWMERFPMLATLPNTDIGYR